MRVGKSVGVDVDVDVGVDVGMCAWATDIAMITDSNKKRNM